MSESPHLGDLPHELLLTEVLLRLFKRVATEGVTLEPYGEPATDSWGSGQWIKMTDAGGDVTYHRLLTEKRDQ